MTTDQSFEQINENRNKKQQSFSFFEDWDF